jgi:hypothetical protein
MARPPKVEQAALVDEGTVAPGEKPTVKLVQMHAGIDMIGSKVSIDSRRADIYERPTSVLIVSKETGRKVVIPHSNIRGYELL